MDEKVFPRGEVGVSTLVEPDIPIPIVLDALGTPALVGVIAPNKSFEPR